MIYRAADGYHVRLFRPEGVVWEYGPYRSRSTAMDVRDRLERQLAREARRSQPVATSATVPSLPLFGELP